MKRVFALVLSLCMILAMVPAVSAAETGKVGVYDGITTVYYDTVEEALGAYEESTITLYDDVTAGQLIIPEGVTLDLNGYTLTANMVIAFNGVICRGNVSVAEGMLKIIGDNDGYVPVWDPKNETYSFATVNYQQMINVAEDGSSAQYIFVPYVDDATAALLADGGADNGVSVKVQMSWNGGASVQYYTFNEDLVATVYGGNYAMVFSLSISGIAGIEDMVISAVVESAAGGFARNEETPVAVPEAPAASGEIAIEAYGNAEWTAPQDGYVKFTINISGATFAVLDGWTPVAEGVDSVTAQVTAGTTYGIYPNYDVTEASVVTWEYVEAPEGGDQGGSGGDVEFVPSGEALALGDNNVTLTYANMPAMAPYWTYTATENGYLTVTVTSINGESNLGMAFGRGVYTLLVGEATGEYTNTATVYMNEGEMVQIAVLDTMDMEEVPAVINLSFEAGSNEPVVEKNPADYFDRDENGNYVIGSLEGPVDIFVGNDDINYIYVAEADGTVTVTATVADTMTATNCWFTVNGNNTYSSEPVSVVAGDVVIINIWSGYEGTLSFEAGEVGGSTEPSEPADEKNPADYFDRDENGNYVIGSLEGPVDIFVGNDDINYIYVAEKAGTVTVNATVADVMTATNCWIITNGVTDTSAAPVAVVEGDVVIINIWSGYEGTVTLSDGAAEPTEPSEPETEPTEPSGVPSGSELALGDNEVSLTYATMPMMAPYWTYTARENGYLDVIVSSINGNSELGMAFGMGSYTLLVGEATGEWTNSARVYMNAGEMVQIAVLDTVDMEAAVPAIINLTFEAGEAPVVKNPADYFDRDENGNYVIGSLESPVDIFVGDDDICYIYTAEADGVITVTATVDGYTATNCWYKVTEEGSFATYTEPFAVKAGEAVIINIWGSYEGTVSLEASAVEPSEPVVESATITFDDTAKRTEYDTEHQIWVENGIVVANNKGNSTSNVGDYFNPARFYKNTILKIEYVSSFNKIVFDSDATSKYLTALQDSITIGTVTVEDDIITVVLDEPTTALEMTMTGGQVRLDALTVSYDSSLVGGGEDPVEPSEPETEPTEPVETEPVETEPVETEPENNDPAADSVLTIAEAIALGASKEHDTYTTNKYYVTGVITEVYNVNYGNMYIADDAGNILTIYGTYNADGTVRYNALEVKPVAGDTVTVYGIIGQYNGTAQIKNGWITDHIDIEVEEPTETTPDPEADTNLSIADAITLGASKSHDTYTAGKYYVTGVITEVYNATYGNMKITDDAGNILTIYGTYNADGTVRYDALEVQPVAGDTVTVYGIIGQYNGTAQIKNGWIVAHTAAVPEETEATEPVETEPVETEPENNDPAADSVLTIAEAIALGASKEKNVYTEGKYYVTGVITQVDEPTYGNVYITDGNGNYLYVYGLYSADGSTRYDAMEAKPDEGDTVTLYGVIGKYTDPQMKSAWVISYTPGELEKEEVEGATITFNDKAKRTSFSTSEQIWEENGIIVTNSKASSTSNVADYASPVRFYKSSSVTVEYAAGINQIVFDCNSASYATALVTSLSTENVTVGVENDKVTVTFSIPVTSYTVAALSAQVRMDSITVS